MAIIDAPRDLVMCVSPFGRPDTDVVLAASRAGALGVLDLGRDLDRARHALGLIVAGSDRAFGARVPPSCRLAPDELPPQVDTVVVADLSEDLERWAGPGRRVLVEVRTRDEGRLARDEGADGVVIRGSEGGGRIGEETAFVLLSALAAELAVPIWVGGGIGLHTAAGAVAAGATGVVLDGQLALLRESGAPADLREVLRAMDGSETVVIGGYRVLSRPGSLAASLVGRDPGADPLAGAAQVDPGSVEDLLGGEDLLTQLVPVGQEGAFASVFADRWRTVEGVVAGLRRQIVEHVAAARSLDPLGPGSPLARAHQISYPVAQGPMTRVSDRAKFAFEVAEAGGLPFLALALMTGKETRDLLEETVEMMGDRTWGVGVLGFVPEEVRSEQLAVVNDVRPQVALIAGGRPSQARVLEQAGIATYLHVPSPALLERFVKDGARRFVFEGRECGGHVGPRSSFALWEAQIDVLLRTGAAADSSVLFAGGVHDARSAAAVAASGAGLAQAGAKLGVLMGTAYLFTEEAVAAGAVVAAYQEEALACRSTVLLETSPGHATRCAETEYVRAFRAERQRLANAGADPQEAWAALEVMNLGRLRLASKGLEHQEQGLVPVAPDVQRREGMYMLGQVAASINATTSIDALHEDVSAGSTRVLDEAQTRCARFDLVTRPPAPAPAGIAIVGMACVFPGAPDVETFWSNIVAGADAVTEVPPDRWEPDLYYDPDAVTTGAGRKTPSKWGGFLPSVPFDALSFGIPPNSLASIEPVQLLSLKVAADALADAGYGPGSRRELCRDRVSVVFGAEAGTDLASAYGFRSLAAQYLGSVPKHLDDFLPVLTEDSFPGLLTNVIAGRIANRLDLGGVNFTVDAACASSLAALDAAVKELRAGTSDMVLCGGADLHNGINDYLLFAAVHALSPTGRCASFDASADGIALGEGVACVVLKRLEDARRDGTRIYAVIEGVAGSSDGRSLGLTAPRPEGQRRALERAYEQAGIGPDEVGLIEAHGTGTVVGDRTELGVLTEMFAASGALPASCGLGSVKSQIGHTKCAAGLASIIKAARALHHGVLPPTIHVTEPNPAYDPEHGPFAIHTSAQPWCSDHPVAGVSAFGFGGTNFHAVLRADDQAGRSDFGTSVWPEELFVVRAATRHDAVAYLDQLETWLGALPEGAGRAALPNDLLASVASSAARRSGPVHASIVAGSLEELRQRAAVARAALAGDHRAGTPDHVTGPDDGVHVAGTEHREAGRLAFLYPGQGSQRPGMLAELFVAFPWLQRHLEPGRRFLGTLFPPAAFTPAERRAQAAAITDTRVAQPALGLVDLAMADLLQRLGVVPQMSGGHSYGELVALAAAGALPRERLCEISERRAHAIVEAAGEDPGAMAAVSAGADAIADVLREVPEVVLGNDNSPGQVVVSGPTAAVEKVVARLQEAGLASKRLPVACAFHSPVVAPAAEAFGAYLESVELRPPASEVWSNTTAGPYPRDPVQLRTVLAEQLARPVRFREQVEAMYKAGARTFVEVGPGRVLTGLVHRILGDREHRALALEESKGSAMRGLLGLLGRLAVEGVDVDFAQLFDGRVAPRDFAGWSPAVPGWLVDGGAVRTADGTVVRGGLRPAMELGAARDAHAQGELAGVAPFRAGEPGEEVVVAYLRAMREMVAAGREVMLGYLGRADPGTAGVAGSDRAEGYREESLGPVEDRERASGPNAAPVAARVTLTLRQAVLDVVAERTGYPVDMLAPGLDLEADLSIDSIKRLEIVGELAERLGLSGEESDGNESELDESVLDELVAVKTLDAMVAWLEERIGGGSLGGSGAPVDVVRPQAEPGGIAVTQPATFSVASPASASRFVLRLADVGDEGSIDDRWADGRDVVLCGGTEIASELARILRGLGASVRLEEPGVPMGSAEVLVYLGALDPVTGPPDDAVIACFESVREAVRVGATTVVAVTGSGGHFGMGGARQSPAPGSAAPDGVGAIAAWAGIRGIVKTLAREHDDVRSRVIDVDPALVPAELGALLASELAHVDAPVEVGRWGERRVSVRVVGPDQAVEPPGSRSGAFLVGEEALDADAVVLVTGGARGITTHVTRALLEKTGCTAVLVGRTPEPPAVEPEETAGALDAVALRGLLARRGFGPPARIEAEVARILSVREVRSTLADLRQAGYDVHYRVGDVSGEAEVRRLLDAVRAEFGRLDGIVHAAGVIEDARLVDKSADSFRRVFRTKVTLPCVLGPVLEHGMRFVVLFGSVSGAFGNRGQVDYAAANAALASIARDLSRRFDGRVLTVDWGPWAGGGMVSPGLERELARRGWGLLEPGEAVRLLFDELMAAEGEPEVLIVRADPESIS